MNVFEHSAVATKPKRPMRTMSAQSKLDAIGRVHAGETKASVARSIGVPESTLRGWCKNEEKILYLSRQSSPGTDESLEQPQPKRIKLEEQRTQPFDFSTKMNGSRACSPDLALDYSKSGPNSPNQPLNMTARMETSNAATQASDSERNQAEFARRLELGLNRPELLLTSNVSAQQADPNAGVAAQWRAIMMQQQQLSLGTIKATAPADTSNMACSSGGLLTIADQDNARYLPRERQSVHESVWHWLKSQHLNYTQAELATQPTINGVVSPTINGMNQTQSSLIWKWYEQAFTQQVQQMSAQDSKPIFHQHLTKEPPQNVSPPPQPPVADLDANILGDSENQVHKLSNHKGKMLLDDLLFNWNNVKQERLDEGMTREEAIEHGERFLAWLEAYSNPSITATHILQFSNLLNNVKGAGERRNCEFRNKRK